jgi:hypothetical protein
MMLDGAIDRLITAFFSRLGGDINIDIYVRRQLLLSFQRPPNIVDP